MLKYLAKRIGRSILTLFIIVTLVFCLLRLMPVEGYFANYEKMTEAQIQAGLQSMGLLDPLPVQIGRFWVNMLHGDLGVSHIYKVNASVTSILAKKLPISIQMGVYAMLLSLVIGIPMGLFMGRFKSRWPDKIGTAIIVLIQAVPAAVYYLYIQMYGTTFTIWKRTAAPTREEVEYYLSAFAEEDAQYPEMFSQVAEAWLTAHGL